MTESLQIQKRLSAFFEEMGDMALFAGRFFKEVFKPPFEFNELLRQCYSMGNRSLLLVGVTGFILGFGFYASVASYFDGIWRTVLDAVHGKYFNCS